MNRSAWLRARTGVTALLLFCGAGLALAQPPQGAPDPDRMAERQLSAMKDRLKLNSDQEKKVKPILAESMKKMMEMRQKFGAPQQGQRPSEEAMAEMRKSREETTKKLAEVLTKDQMKEYEKMLSERRGPGGPGAPGGRRPEQK